MTLYLCLFLFVGCSTEFSDPEKVVRAYYKSAFTDNNYSKTYKYLSSASQKHESADEFAKHLGTGKNRKVEQLSVLPDDKEKATYRRVKVIFETTDEKGMSYKGIKYYTLINEGGKWKIAVVNLLNLAWEQYRKGLYDEAIKRAEEMLTIDPYNADAYDSIAWSSLQLGNEKAFIANAKKTIALEPDVPHHYNTMATYYGTKGLWSLSIENSLKAISMGYGSNADKSGLYSNMAFYLGEGLKDYEKALTTINKAIELNSSNAHSYFIKGRLLLQHDENKEAADAFLKAIDMNDKNKEKLPQNNLFAIFFDLSKAEFAMNDYTNAKKHISMALDIEPDDREAQKLYYQIK